MAGITKAQAEAKLATWLAAEDKVASGQSYSIGGRALTRADLKAIRDSIQYWNEMVQTLPRDGIKIKGVTPQ
jgi:hypothetical protein